MVYLAEEVVKLHAKGLSQKKIAIELDCGLNTVRRRMKELNLVPKSKGSRDYKINSDVFDTIDTEEKAYWLGFFLADGCIAKSMGTRRAFRLSLKKSDEKHLCKAAKFLNYRGKFHPDNRDNHPRLAIVFNDVGMCGTLMDHGWWNYKEGKSFEILDIVPDCLFHHFIRGYYDGDGSITYQRRKRKNGVRGPQKKWYCNITCEHEKSLEIMDKRICVLGGPHSEVRRRSKAYDIRWANRARSKTILNFMYEHATICLERKVARKHEFEGLLPFVFSHIGDFEFDMRTDELIARKDCDEIMAAFMSEVLTSAWYPPVYDYNADYEAIERAPNCLIDNIVIPKSAAGNKFILKYQPMAWHVCQSNPSIASFASCPNIVKTAVRNFCRTKGKALTPVRFVRELRFAGLTMASLLSIPAILAAVKHFGLSGKWFDPCAGWGNRLIAAHALGYQYEATDPGISFNGLKQIDTDLGVGAVLHNKKWQDLEWPQADFVLTSPPFHDKEDYLDSVEYGKFDEWYAQFLRPLAARHIDFACLVLHVDRPMMLALERDFNLEKLPIMPGTRRNAPKEWFVRVCD